MPKTRSYLLKNLSAVEMKGYTKVAENTLPNVVPLLTGLTLEEMKLKCAFKSGLHVQIDSCPFIWHNYSADGYKTSYAEDDIDIGIFNMNWKYAFKNPPTDFYFRPFAQRMQRRQVSFSCFSNSRHFIHSYSWMGLFILFIFVPRALPFINVWEQDYRFKLYWITLRIWQ